MNDESHGLSPTTLRSALEAARARVTELTEAAKSVMAERDVAAREVELLQELLAVREGNAGARMDGDAGRNTQGQESSSRSDRRTRPPNPAVSAAIEELERAGRPLHISELMRLLEGRGVEVPGSGKQANLIAHLTRSPRIERPSRGMYALADWGIRPPLKRATRRRTAGRGKTTAVKAK